MRFFYWLNEEVVPSDHYIRSPEGKPIRLCVDTQFSEAYSRYGFVDAGGVWFPVLLEEFPPEFRTHLLLLGVS